MRCIIGGIILAWCTSIAAGQIFISQYYEGTSNNKWIELYNAGDSHVDLGATGYRLGLWTNTNRENWKINGAPNRSIALSGILSPGSTYLLSHGSAELPSYATANLASSLTINFNGDDSIVLFLGSIFNTTGIVDSIGLTGTNLMDVSIVRKLSITTGNTGTNNMNLSEWDSFTPEEVDNATYDTLESLGYHTPFLTAPDIHYVALNNPTPVPPYTNWTSAATNIQDAVDAALPFDTVLVTNGIYETGGRVAWTNLLTNRVVIDKRILVQSVNGPNVTIIMGAKDPRTTNGNAAVRCAWLIYGASLSGFALTNGATRNFSSVNIAEQSGGGAFQGTLTNCILSGNSAGFGGGGAYQSTLNNCVLTGNSAGDNGGGAYQGILNNCTLYGNAASSGGGAYLGTLLNCTLTGNSANFGGGAFLGTLFNCLLTSNSAAVSGGGTHQGTIRHSTLTGNSAGSSGGGALMGTLNSCIVYFNTAPNGSNYADFTFFTYSCTAPLPAGNSNIFAIPLFEDRFAGNYRLTAASPCRDTGDNELAFGATDLDGSARTNGANVDIGAYEFSDVDNDHLPGWWETYYGLNPAESNTASANSDGDDFSDIEEYIAGTNPSNPSSFFPRIEMTNPPTGVLSLIISNTSAGRIYFIHGTTNLAGPQAWTHIPPDLSGNNTELTITVSTTNDFHAIRAGVRLP